VPSLSPEGFSGLAQCFITRQAEIIEQMLAAISRSAMRSSCRSNQLHHPRR
jgi:hypothetical protein